MGIKSWFAAKLETKADNIYSDQNFFNHQELTNRFAGIDVTYTSALRQQDVYTCVRIKSESIGQLPMLLYRETPNGKVKITSGREHNIFTVAPNPYQTWQELLEMYVTSMELRGNFYCEIKRNKYNSVYQIIPFKYQDSVSVNMDAFGRVYYTAVSNDSQSIQTTRTYQNNQILHIKMNSLDGYKGLSPISYTAQSIGTAIAGETHASNMFQNGARPSGILTTDETFSSDEVVERLRKQWNSTHQGSKNSGKTAILENGLKYQPITMSAVDSQLLEQRKLSREQIASIFRVPSHMLNSASGMKYNTVEHNNTSFFRDSLMPLVTKMENALKQLLPSNHLVTLDERQFVRGDRKSQVDSVTAEIKSGLMSINEGREELGHERVEGGDVFAVSTNNLQFGKWEDLEKIQAQMNSNGLNSTPTKEKDPDKEEEPDEPDE